MSGVAPALFQLDPAKRQVNLVVHDEQVGRGETGGNHEIWKNLAAAIHEGERLDESHLYAADPPLGDARRNAARQRPSKPVAVRESLDDHETGVVTGVRVAGPRVAESDDHPRRHGVTSVPLFLRVGLLGLGLLRVGRLLVALGRDRGAFGCALRLLLLGHGRHDRHEGLVLARDEGDALGQLQLVEVN